MKVFIADDHPIFRQGLLKIMEADPDLEIVGESGDGEEALQLIRSLSPDIAVLDISMPGLSGLEIVSELQKESLKVEFIILTMFAEEEYFDEAMDYGVRGYLLKENAASDLLSCLKSSFVGEESLRTVLDRAGFNIVTLNRTRPQPSFDNPYVCFVKNIARWATGRPTVPLGVPRDSRFLSLWVYARARG